MNTKLVMKCHNAGFGCDEQAEKTATLRGPVLLVHAVVDQHEVLGTIPSTGKINKMK